MRKATKNEKQQPFPSDDGNHKSSLKLWKLKHPQYSFSEMNVENSPNVRMFTIREIRKATNDFEEARCVGEGEFGKVYWGVVVLKGAFSKVYQKVAIKRAHKKSSQRLHQFRTEIGMLSDLRHTHIVPLIGFCEEHSEMILVYDYMSRGSLSQHLYGDDSQKPPLPWEQRLEICIGIARALRYIHAQAASRVIVHQSVNTKSILLDGNWVAKLSDFGLSMMDSAQKIHPVPTKVALCFTHADPEYVWLGRLREKSDVYLFGVVLLEVLCRRLVVVGSDWALQCHENGVLDQIMDPYLKGKITPGCWKIFAETCAKCVADRGTDRAAMADVLSNLELSLKLQQVEERLYSKFPFMGIRSGWTNHQSIDLLRRLFTLMEMRKATNDFDQVLQIREVEFGKVFRGAIDGGVTQIAIKRARRSKTHQQGRQWHEFLKDVEMHSRLRHRHIVPLIGCCIENSEMIIVYDYMERGNLREHLYMSQKPPLSWKRRLEICIGVARGLHYIHTQATNHHLVVHRGIQTSNILLDYNWVAKISDFKLSTLGSVRDLVPEKSDVYSFGVVLLEVLCARPPLDTTLPGNQAELVEWALHCHKKSMLEECIDPHLKGKITPKCLKVFVQTAAKCLADNGIEQTAMGDVLRNLESALQLEESANAPLWRWPPFSTIPPGQTELPKQTLGSRWMPSSCRQYSLEEMEFATCDFDEALCVGEGVFGRVYKGSIEGTDVAIKRAADHQQDEYFKTVIATLSMLCHRNLVSLLGYCNEDSRMILVYEYTDRGNLQQRLYCSENPSLPWEQRLRICIEVARALSYLHAGAAAKYAIIHGNVKTTNILLNKEWVPKLSGFERSTKTSAQDPDIKSDVKSFGDVLFEVLCASRGRKRDLSLPERALHWLKYGRLEEIIDHRLKGQITSVCLKLFVEVAQKCWVDQPTMGDVVRDLEVALQLLLQVRSDIRAQFTDVYFFH